jgi:hypothetical protein
MGSVTKTCAVILPAAVQVGRASTIEVELERRLGFTIVARRYMSPFAEPLHHSAGM